MDHPESSQQDTGPWSRVGWGLAVLLGVIAIWCAVQVGARYDDPVYRFEPIDLVWVGIGGVSLLAGAVLLVKTERSDIAVLTTLTSVLIVPGLVSILSIGVFLLLAALVPGFILIRRLRRPSPRWHLALLIAPLMMVGVVTLILTVPRSPVVECHPDGSVTSSGSGSGRGSSGPDGSGEGVLHFDDATYTFRCEDGSLTEFSRSPA